MPNTINVEITNLIKYSRIMFKDPKITNLTNLIQFIDNSLDNIQCLVFLDFLFKGKFSVELKLVMINNIGINRFVKLVNNFIEKNINELSSIFNDVLKVGIETSNECYLLCLLEKIGNNKLIKLIKYTHSQNIKLHLCERISTVYLSNNSMKVLIDLLNNLDFKELDLIQTNNSTNISISDNLSIINKNKFLYHLYIVGDFNYRLFKNEIKQNNINSTYLSNVIGKILNENDMYKNKLEFKASLLDSCVRGILSMISNLTSTKDIIVSLEERMCTKLLNSLFKKISDSEIIELYNTDYVKTSLEISYERGIENAEQLKLTYLKRTKKNKNKIPPSNPNNIGTFIEKEIISRDLKKTKQSKDTGPVMSSLLNRMTRATTDCNCMQSMIPIQNLYFH